MIVPYGRVSKYSGHPELRIMLGSFLRHVSGIRNVYVVGVDPGPLPSRCTWIPFQQGAWNKECAIARVLSYGMQHAPEPLTTEVMIQGDDHIATRPFDAQDLRAPAGKSLRALADKNPQRTYSKALRATSRYLSARGHTEYHYDYHMPMIVDPVKWVALEEHWKASEQSSYGMVCKSLYGNIYACPPQFMADHKANKVGMTVDTLAEAILTRPVISYGDKCAPLVFSLFSEYLK